MSQENRTLRRNRAMKTVQFVHVQNGTYYDCRFVDLNSRGGRIRFEKTQLVGEIGDRVELLMKPEGVKVLACLAWKTEKEFGVSFDKPLAWLAKHDVPARGAKV